MAPTYKLQYFNITGLGETPRMMLALTGAEWENAVPDWKAEKDNAPFGKMPVLIIQENGKEVKLAQSPAICRYLAAKHELVPKDPLQCAIADSVVETVADFRTKLIHVIFHVKGEEQEKAKKELQETSGPAFIKYLSRMLQQNGNKGIFVGDKIGLPEVALHFVVRGTQKNFPGVFTEDNAADLLKVCKAVEQDSRIQAYLASDKHFRNSPV
ncbi:hypothetical protein RI367_000217 [Sorochytrium milnesiophthora]